MNGKENQNAIGRLPRQRLQLYAHAPRKVWPLKEALNKGINDSIEELRAKKQLTQLENETKKREEALFFEQMHLEADAEKKIEELKDMNNLKVEMYRLFHV